jgi:UDP-N-acetylmuramoyl-tripeptide--D-alanyl-D-alanine ligase
LPVVGSHMVRNALMAVASGLALGMCLEDCVSGLARLELSGGRLQRKQVRGIEVLDDTYNANPDSVKAALRTLAGLPAAGRRVAVIGRMGELGEFSEEGHAQVGGVAAELGLDLLIGVGTEPEGAVAAARVGGLQNARAVKDVSEALEYLRAWLGEGDIVLVKGSRSARMERVVEGLMAS